MGVMGDRPGRREFLAGAAACAGVLAGGRRISAATPERKLYVDLETGVEFWQITSFPTVNQNLYFHSRCWTADGKSFLFQSQHEARRGAASDLFRADVDGLGLEQLTDGRAWENVALHPSKPLAYFLESNAVLTLDIDTKKISEVGKIEGRGVAWGHPGSFTDDGRLYCFAWRSPDGTSGFGVFDTEKGASKVVPLGINGKFTHLQIEPGAGKLCQFVTDGEDGKIAVMMVDMDGKAERLPFKDANGHNAWLGATGKVYADMRGERRDIWVARPGEGRAEILAKSPPSFWHTGASPEGDWLVSDTNSPDDGLYLISARTGKSARLLRAGSSEGHSQYTHPHPSVSPGARHVVFNSDRTGIPHVYCAAIPEEMKRGLL